MKVTGLKWFFDEPIEFLGRFATPRDQDDWNIRVRCPYSLSEFDAIAMRHLNVAYNQTQTLSKLLHDLKTADAIASLDGAKILLLKDHGNVAPD